MTTPNFFRMAGSIVVPMPKASAHHLIAGTFDFEGHAVNMYYSAEASREGSIRFNLKFIDAARGKFIAPGIGLNKEDCRILYRAAHAFVRTRSVENGTILKLMLAKLLHNYFSALEE